MIYIVVCIKITIYYNLYNVVNLFFFFGYLLQYLKKIYYIFMYIVNKRNLNTSLFIIKITKKAT